MFGEAQKLGNGTVKIYAMTCDDGKLTSIGVVFKASMLERLPPVPNRTSRCFDLNNNGRIFRRKCEGDYELRLSLPAAFAKRADVPFRWVGLNWSPHGHPPKAWKSAHVPSSSTTRTRNGR